MKRLDRPRVLHVHVTVVVLLVCVYVCVCVCVHVCVHVCVCVCDSEIKTPVKLKASLQAVIDSTHGENAHGWTWRHAPRGRWEDCRETCGTGYGHCTS